MEALLTSIVFWLSAEFGLPVTLAHPRVTEVPRIELASIRLTAAGPGAGRPVAAAGVGVDAGHGWERIVALYDTRSHTIFLADGWRPDSPADVSVLVHEVVHHLQTAAGLRYACPAERERLAYRAQDAWLARFDRSLESEFGIDRMTLLVLTTCTM